MTDAAETKLSGSNLGTNTVEGSLQACIGECDDDVDCATGLLCFQRSNGEDIPGCTGNGGGNGWCVLSPLFPLKCLAPPVTSNSPVASPPPSPPPRFLLSRDYCYDPSTPNSDGLITLAGSNLGTSTVPYSLQACIGECDKDEDCATGLLCFQRSNGEDIPGCTGDGGGDNWCVCCPLSRCAHFITLTFPLHFNSHASFFSGITATTPITNRRRPHRRPHRRRSRPRRRPKTRPRRRPRTRRRRPRPHPRPHRRRGIRIHPNRPRRRPSTRRRRPRPHPRMTAGSRRSSER